MTRHNKNANIWETTPIIETPEIELAHWQIYECSDSGLTTRHFVGFNLTEVEGRVSSAILIFDMSNMRGITASGRVYALVGDPSKDPDADYVWQHWKQINSITEYKNVTSDTSDWPYK
jgi:hypothetical protein